MGRHLLDRQPSLMRLTSLPPHRHSENTMRASRVIAFSLFAIPSVSFAQASPTADAFRNEAMRAGKNLVAAAEVMPADKYSFKPTPAQMSFGDIVDHLSGGND